ncbi:nucleoside-diphosphate-sugar epimerase-like protein [Salinisphaera sp. T5B8]|uniref:mitochondrial fission ELM1 family protein n=1 Tax=Salinisphaera sp. T5B8 TaxID=1304154 RepID=UPI003341C50F
MADSKADTRVAPKVWVLLGEGAGGNAQMCRLADALGWPYQAKQMRYNRWNHLPNPLLGATDRTLDRQRSDAIGPPWPDLVIAASRRAAPLARWIKRQSGGRTRLVHLLHTQAPLHHFDLIVTLPQFRVPDAPNVLRNTLPLNTLDAARLTRAAERWRPQFAHWPRPWIAVLVGGDSSSYRLDADTARRLAERANALAAEMGGSLLVTTSPRTPDQATRVLRDTVREPAYFYAWQRGGGDNPYDGFLALADRFLVTADSASLPAEACATGRPVELFTWAPRKPLFALGRLRQRPVIRRAERALIYSGAIKPRRDFAAFHARLAEFGLIDGQGGAKVPDDLGRTVAHIRALMGDNSFPLAPSVSHHRSTHSSAHFKDSA